MSKILGKGTKLILDRTIVRSITLYAMETLTMKREDEELRIMEKKMMRIILGSVKIVVNKS